MGTEWGHRAEREFRAPLSGSAEQIKLRRRSELLEFLALGAMTRLLADSAFGREFGLFEVAQDFLGAVEDRFGDSGQAGDLDAVTLVGAAGNDLAQENDLVVPLANGDVEVLQPGQSCGELGQFVIVSGEERFGADLVVEVFHDGPGQAQAVEGAGAAPKRSS